jgi:hypothetical protein
LDPEILLETLVGRELQRRKIFSVIKGSFVSSVHVLCNQGRSSMPSDYDCNLGYTMGYAAGVVLRGDRSGLLVAVDRHHNSVYGIPITSIINIKNFDSVIGECRIEIERKKFTVSKLRNILPPPSRRRFVNPGPLQWNVVEEQPVVESLGDHDDDQLEKMSQLCSQVMSLAATATDERVRNMIGAGLKYALQIVGAPLPQIALTEGLRSRANTMNSFNGMNASVISPRNSERGGNLRRTGSHCRVVKIVPC